MFLVDVREFAEQMIEQYLPDQGWRFEFDNARKRMGACFYRRKLITMSRVLCRKADGVEVRDTVRHEIAHAIAGHGAGHGPAWKRVARAIGCNAERCHTVDVSTGAKYVGTCSKCGASTYLHRKPKYDMQTAYRCRECKITVVIEKIR